MQYKIFNNNIVLQCAKNIMLDTMGLLIVDFPVKLMDSDLHLHDRQSYYRSTTKR